MTKTHLALQRHFRLKSINDPVTMLDSRLVIKRMPHKTNCTCIDCRRLREVKVAPKLKWRWTREQVGFWAFWIVVYGVIGFWIIEYWFKK